MKVITAIATDVHAVTTDGEGWNTFTRHSADHWSALMGESEEQIYAADELDDLETAFHAYQREVAERDGQMPRPDRIEFVGRGEFAIYQGGVKVGRLKDGVTPLIHATWANLLNTNPELADTYIAGIAHGIKHMVMHMYTPEYAHFMANEDA